VVRFSTYRGVDYTYDHRWAADEPSAAMSLDDAVSTVTAGIALVIAQSKIVAAPFFDEKEIRKFLALRRQFHGQFVAACKVLGEAIDDGTLGAGAKPAAPGLRAIEHLSPTQDRQALVAVVRILRGLKHLKHTDVDARVFRLIRHAIYVIGEDNPSEDDQYGWRSREREEMLKDVIRLEVVPAPIRTLLRKILKLPSSEVSEEPHEETTPGAFFEMDEGQKAALRAEVERLTAERAEIMNAWQTTDADTRSKLYKENAAALAKVQREAGVNVETIRRSGTPAGAAQEEPLDVVLKRESKNDPDGPTEWILKQVSDYVRRSAEYAVQRTKGPSRKRRDNKPDDKPVKPKSVPMEYKKLLTLIEKSRSFDTLLRIIQEAVNRRILTGDAVTDIKRMIDEAQKNIAIKEGIPLVPLTWQPTTPEEFQARHDTGPIEFSDDIPEEKRHELLGRVSRAVSDLETVFGKGFCGKHGKKLAFNFGGSSSFMAKAHYFQWDDRRTWQPRVTFGEDYEGVLAHELSHYLDDMVSRDLAARDNPEHVEKMKREFGVYSGPGGVANTGVPLDYVTDKSNRAYIDKTLPELSDVLKAIRNTPDYKRWEDMLGNLMEFTGDKAVETLTGKSRYDLPKDHPYAKALDAQYKSEVPPELLAEATKRYTQMMDGDNRKLTYYHSATEVWARVTEQYVYTKLARQGVSNPWLTWLQYDDPKYIEQARFEKEIMPLYDKLFAAMKDRKIIAQRVLDRFLTRLNRSAFAGR
jgi:hypothetical protein